MICFLAHPQARPLSNRSTVPPVLRPPRPALALINPNHPRLASPIGTEQRLPERVVRRQGLFPCAYPNPTCAAWLPYGFKPPIPQDATGNPHLAASSHLRLLPVRSLAAPLRSASSAHREQASQHPSQRLTQSPTQGRRHYGNGSGLLLQLTPLRAATSIFRTPCVRQVGLPCRGRWLWRSQCLCDGSRLRDCREGFGGHHQRGTPED